MQRAVIFTLVLVLITLLAWGCSILFNQNDAPTLDQTAQSQDGMQTGPANATRTATATRIVSTQAAQTATKQTAGTQTASALPPTPTPTRTPTRTPTPTPTPTPLPLPQINILIPTCDTGVDIFNRLGEVTNAYVTIQNVGQAGATGVEVVLDANDEEKEHPNKSYHIGYLPAGTEISLKLTVDTKNRVDTSLTVTVTTAEGVTESAAKSSCRARRSDPTVIKALGELFKVRDLPPAEKE